MGGTSADAIPVVDLFAGPGGLNEGFCAFRAGKRRVFRSVVSIEKETSAHATLRLRAFFRGLSGQALADYYRMVRGEISIPLLYELHPRVAMQAAAEAVQVELGAANVEVVRGIIQRAIPKAQRDRFILLGGPPCQPFSLAGRSRNRRGTRYSDGKETRHELYVEYLQIIADFAPAVFVMENVRGLTSAQFNNERMFDRIRSDLENPAQAIRRIGRSTLARGSHTYHIYAVGSEADVGDFVVRCEEHGIPQARHRVILLGVRDDVHAAPARLSPDRQSTVKQALQGLPKIRSGLSRDDSAEAWLGHLNAARNSAWLRYLRSTDRDIYDKVVDTLADLRAPQQKRGKAWIEFDVRPDPAFEWLHDASLEGVTHHESRSHMASDLHRYLFCACFARVRRRSPTLEDFRSELIPAHQSAVGGHFADRFRVQMYGRPSTTIVSHIAKDGHYYIHPDPSQCRSLTVREAARLQTFPDNYFFVGNRTQQYTQVGNAVPPMLGCQLAGLVHNVLVKAGMV